VCKAGEKKHREIFEIFQKYFMKYFRAKKIS